MTWPTGVSGLWVVDRMFKKMQPWDGVAKWGANGKASMEVQAAAFLAQLSLARADPGENVIRGLFSPSLGPLPAVRGG